MEKTKMIEPDKIAIHISEIPIESNLGLLAYGDIAFTAWREQKKKIKQEGSNETE